MSNESTREGLASDLKKKKIWLIAVMAAVATGIIYGVFITFIHGGTGAISVSQFQAQAASLENEAVTVKGRVVSGSVSWDEGTKTTGFALAGGGESLNVVYSGVVPDHFKPGAEIEVRGRYGSGGVFQAESIGGENAFCAVCH